MVESFSDDGLRRRPDSGRSSSRRTGNATMDSHLAPNQGDAWIRSPDAGVMEGAMKYVLIQP